LPEHFDLVPKGFCYMVTYCCLPFYCTQKRSVDLCRSREKNSLRNSKRNFELSWFPSWDFFKCLSENDRSCMPLDIYLYRGWKGYVRSTYLRGFS